MKPSNRWAEKDRGISIPQYRTIIKIIDICGIQGHEISKAIKTPAAASNFISKWKPKMEKTVSEENEEQLKQEMMLDLEESQIIGIVQSGRCPDVVAAIRGYAIMKVLNLKMVNGRVKTSYGLKSAEGLYRSVMRGIIESKEEVFMNANSMAKEAQQYIDRYPHLKDAIIELITSYSNMSEKKAAKSFSADVLQLVENQP